MELDRKLLCKSVTSGCCSVPGCKMNHTDRATCNFDRGCIRANCKFNHSVALCRFKPICTNDGCQFRHTLEQKKRRSGQNLSSSRKDLTADFGNANQNVGQRTRSSSRPDQDCRRVGIFWDIENCPIPKHKSVCEVIADIRNYFVTKRNHREFEFMIACDTTRLPDKVCDDINKAGEVTLAHVNGTSKNAADEKLRERMKIFVEAHRASGPMMLVLCSGDIDFVNDLRGYKNRELIHIVLLHSRNCSRQFQIGWDETYVYDEFCSGLINNGAVSPRPGANHPKPSNSNVAAAASAFGNGNVGWGAAQAAAAATTQNVSAPKPGSSKPKPGPGQGREVILAVTGFPVSKKHWLVRDKLQPHADQVEGVVKYVRDGVAYVSFKSQSNANQALEHFNGMKIFGGVLAVSRHNKPIPFENVEEYEARKRKEKERAKGSVTTATPTPAPQSQAEVQKKTEAEEAVQEKDSCSIQ